MINLCSLRNLLDMTSRSIDKIKSVQRIHESMKMFVHFRCFMNPTINGPFVVFDSVVHLLTFEEFRIEKAHLLYSFLAHAFPRVTPLCHIVFFH